MSDVKKVKHVFGMGQTIEAAIRYHHGNIKIPREKMDSLLQQFNVINGNSVPKMGQSYWIPIDEEML